MTRLRMLVILFAMLLVPLSACGGGNGGGGGSSSDSDAGNMQNGDGGSTSQSYEYTSIHSANLRGVCGITKGGKIVCKGSSTFPSTPGTEYFVSDSSNYVDAAVAQGHFCGLTESNSVKCWGSDIQGQSDIPSGTYKDVTAGVPYTCVIDNSDKVTCHGDLGMPPSVKAKSVEGGGNGFACLITTSGEAKCWGSDTFEALEPPSKTFKQISVGNYHGCGVTDGGSVACWGTGSDPMMTSPGTAANQAVPPSGKFESVASGKLHTCALDSAGKPTCWGMGSKPNEDEGVSGRFDDDQASPPDETFEQVVAGANYSCGLLASGGVRCWGNNPAEITLP